MTIVNDFQSFKLDSCFVYVRIYHSKLECPILQQKGKQGRESQAALTGHCLLFAMRLEIRVMFRK